MDSVFPSLDYLESRKQMIEKMIENEYDLFSKNQTKNAEEVLEKNIKELMELKKRSEIDISFIEKIIVPPVPYKVYASKKRSYECAICLDDEIPQNSIARTQCNHYFHKDCINDWVETGNNTCPICRSRIRVHYF